MLRTLAVGSVLFFLLPQTPAQQPKVPNEEPVLRAVRQAQAREQLELLEHLATLQAEFQAHNAAPGQALRRFWTEEQVERFLFQEEGTALEMRQRLHGLLTAQLAMIEQACTLSAAQKAKLLLAGDGDIKRFFDRYESIKRGLQASERQEPNFQELHQQVLSLREVSKGLFQEESLLCKALTNTLTGEQFGRYEALRRQRRTFAEVRLLQGHQGAGWRGWVTRLAVAPDGRRIVTVGGDAIRLWDIETGKALRVFGRDQSGYWSVAFSPDGRHIATGSNDRTARLWDADTGREVRRFTGHTEAIWGVAFVAGGRQLVTGAWDRSLRVWDVQSGKQLRKFQGVHDNVRCLACSPDGRWIAAGHFADHHQPGILRLWDLAQGEEIVTMRGHTKEISSVAFSPDGRLVLTSGYDNTLRLWEVPTGREIKRLEGHTNRIEGASFSPDGRFIVSCGDQHDATVRIWDAAQGQQLLCSDPVPEGFLSVASLPAGRYVVTAGKDSMVRVWPWKQASHAP